ncbi:MAG: hypothetical protein OXU79_03060 [Gemmatimonadota bacterium]|nr:hypothetical protein [Gemmatimonadota bacterium]
MRDPIVEETRKLREEYAAQFNHDQNAIFHDILKRQSQRGRKQVSFPSRQFEGRDALAPNTGGSCRDRVQNAFGRGALVSGLAPWWF